MSLSPPCPPRFTAFFKHGVDARPPGRGAHVQLLLFLRPSVLVMECSPNISLTSAETLPRAFGPVLTQCRSPAALSHDVYRTREALCCHKGRRDTSHVCEVTGSSSRETRRATCHISVSPCFLSASPVNTFEISFSWLADAGMSFIFPVLWCW